MGEYFCILFIASWFIIPSLLIININLQFLCYFCSNEIAELEGIDYTNLTNSLNTLFLGSNDISHVPSSFFTSFNHLLWLNLDDNHIRDLPDGCMPPSVLTLSIQNNHISKFPIDLVDSLPALTWFTLRGNYIESIPTGALPSVYGVASSTNKRHVDKVTRQKYLILIFFLEKIMLLINITYLYLVFTWWSLSTFSLFYCKLDFGENFITSVTPDMFGGTLRVNDLNLDHNYIESIGSEAFASLEPRRLYLAANRITSVNDDAFKGAEANLELVDLEGNRLNDISPAFGMLKRLR